MAITIRNVFRKSVSEVTLTGSCEAIYRELVAEGHKVNVNRYGLQISGRRVSWQTGYWLAFLGTPIGKTPKIIRTL